MQRIFDGGGQPVGALHGPDVRHDGVRACSCARIARRSNRPAKHHCHLGAGGLEGPRNADLIANAPVLALLHGDLSCCKSKYRSSGARHSR